MSIIYIHIYNTHLSLWLILQQIRIKRSLTNRLSNPPRRLLSIFYYTWNLLTQHLCDTSYAHPPFRPPPHLQVWCIWVHIKHLTDDEIEKKSWKHCNQVVKFYYLYTLYIHVKIFFLCFFIWIENGAYLPWAMAEENWPVGNQWLRASPVALVFVAVSRFPSVFPPVPPLLIFLIVTRMVNVYTPGVAQTPLDLLPSTTSGAVPHFFVGLFCGLLPALCVDLTGTGAR